MKKKVGEGSITENPRTPRFYTKSKIRKEGIPERPVISSVGKYWNILITTYNQ